MSVLSDLAAKQENKASYHCAEWLFNCYEKKCPSEELKKAKENG